MKQKITLLITFISLFSVELFGQITISPIDSLYMNSLETFYDNAINSSNKIWQGMEVAPVCLFRVDGPAFLYNHPNPPSYFKKVSGKLYAGTQKEAKLFGATQVKINGILTAVVDYGLDNYSTSDEALAELFHEMHHVYQRNKIKQIKFDNPAILLTYPENYINDGIKLYEQRVLYKMCFAENEDGFQRLINQFYSCRVKREKIIGGLYTNYEQTVENMEGPAFYCEYQYYKHFAQSNEAVKENYYQKHFFGILTTPFYGRTNLRKRHLAAGMAMCYILDKYYKNWKNEYYHSGEDLYDFFLSKFKHHLTVLPDLKMFYSMAKYHTSKVIARHRINLDHFNAQPGIKVIIEFNSIPQFRGFDPMHAESVNDSTILHKTLLNLANKDNHLFIVNKEVLTHIKDQIWFVDKVEFFVPNKSVIHNDAGKILTSLDGVNIKWKGKILTEKNDLIVIKCE